MDTNSSQGCSNQFVRKVNELPFINISVCEMLAIYSRLSTLARGAYSSLILHYWHRSRGLPNNNNLLATWAGLRTEDWMAIRSEVEPCFQIINDEWRDIGLEQRMDEIRARSEKSRDAGQKSGASRRAKKEAFSSSANDNFSTSGFEQAKSKTKAKTKYASAASDTEGSRTALADKELVAFQKEIHAAFAAAGSATCLDASRAIIWLQNGWKPEVCLAVITERLAKKPSISSLKYFENAIAEAHSPVAVSSATSTPKTFGKPASGPPVRLSVEETKEKAKELGRVYVLRDTPAGEAWANHHRQTTGKSMWWDQNGGRYFDAEFPPVADSPE